MNKQTFICECSHVFTSDKETTFSEAKPGEYWFTAEGYVGKCPYCGSYAKSLTPLAEPISNEIMGRILHEQILDMFGLQKNKEENTMKVSYKGVTGGMVRLERIEVPCNAYSAAHPYKWELDIWDNEKDCKVSFSNVSLKDVKFLGGEVTYG